MTRLYRVCSSVAIVLFATSLPLPASAVERPSVVYLQFTPSKRVVPLLARKFSDRLRSLLQQSPNLRLIDGSHRPEPRVESSGTLKKLRAEIERVKKLLARKKYREALKKLKPTLGALRKPAARKEAPRLLIEAHVLMARGYYGRSYADNGDDHLAAAVRLDPALKLPDSADADLRESLERMRKIVSFQVAASITIEAPTGAKVELNGREVGRAPLTLKKVPRGDHVLRVSKPGYKSSVEMLTVEPKKDKTVRVTLLSTGQKDDYSAHVTALRAACGRGRSAATSSARRPS